MTGDHLFRYVCDTCGRVVETVVPIHRAPGLWPHPDSGFWHYVGDELTERCGPMKRSGD